MKTRYVAQPASYPMDTGGNFLAGKQTKHEAKHFCLVYRLKMHLHFTVRHFIKHGDNITFNKSLDSKVRGVT
jgi:hypothetical protein